MARGRPAHTMTHRRRQMPVRRDVGAKRYLTSQTQTKALYGRLNNPMKTKRD